MNALPPPRDRHLLPVRGPRGCGFVLGYADMRDLVAGLVLPQARRCTS
ncbi:hypothetical protein [Streptomyces sp. CS62]